LLSSSTSYSCCLFGSLSALANLTKCLPPPPPLPPLPPRRTYPPPPPPGLQAFHFIIGYSNSCRSSRWSAGTLCSALHKEGLRVWLDRYQLENGGDAARAMRAAAEDACHAVLIITPAFITDRRCCAMLATILQRKVPHG
jgi:hypothetical protein